MDSRRLSQEKKLLIGVDEAGYGPNLGPLVIGCSAWLIPAEYSEAEFSHAFENTFSCASWSKASNHIPLGDSKKLYQSGSGLTTLEVGLLSQLGTMHPLPLNLTELVDLIVENSVSEQLVTDSHRPDSSALSAVPDFQQELPWYSGLASIPIPHCETIDGRTIVEMSIRANDVLASREIRLVSVSAFVITEPAFNRLVGQLGSKGSLLSQLTLLLVGRLINRWPDYPAVVFCDRQGGRKNYFPQLLDWMPNRWFIETLQSTKRCSYRADGTPDLEVHFSVGGDAFPATALASMTAKYLRERLMESLNQFWRCKITGLKPTAGYPVDARRFRNDILSTAKLLGLKEDAWWRCR